MGAGLLHRGYRRLANIYSFKRTNQGDREALLQTYSCNKN